MSFIFFFIIVVPIYLLLHEIGHGIGAVVTSKSDVHIFLGLANKHNKENFRIGRFRFHIRWAYIGFVYWDKSLDKRQSMYALAGGPVMSLLLAFLFGFLSFYVVEFRQFFGWSATYNLIQFIVTIIPVKYPQWMGAYGGLSSDGLQLVQTLRKSKIVV